jgi:hypothetical protein
VAWNVLTLVCSGTPSDYDSWGLENWQSKDLVDWFMSAETYADGELLGVFIWSAAASFQPALGCCRYLREHWGSILAHIRGWVGDPDRMGKHQRASCNAPVSWNPQRKRLFSCCRAALSQEGSTAMEAVGCFQIQLMGTCIEGPQQQQGCQVAATRTDQE